MICAGVNKPVAAATDELLRRTRGIGLDEYLAPIVDVLNLDPPYIGPPLPAGTDVWGVHRRPVSYGPGEYLEIDNYPLANVTLDGLRSLPSSSTTATRSSRAGTCEASSG